MSSDHGSRLRELEAQVAELTKELADVRAERDSAEASALIIHTELDAAEALLRASASALSPDPSANECVICRDVDNLKGQPATICDAHYRLAVQAEADASALREAANPPATLDLAVIDIRLTEVAEMHTNSGGSATHLGAYWEGYAEGLQYAKRLALTDQAAALASPRGPSSPSSDGR